MPTKIQFDHRDAIDIVLVSPRNPLNIGAVARAMANFGFSHLTVVAPYEPHWREAKSAVGAEQLLASARVAQTLSEALSDCTFVLGTASLTSRQPEQLVIELPNATTLIRDRLTRGERIAIVFGPEKRGLTREDLALCHALLTIPTADAQPSMNLAQAVAVCLYEISARFVFNFSPSQHLGAPGSGSPRTGLRPCGEDLSHLEIRESTNLNQPSSPSTKMGAPGPSHLGTRESTLPNDPPSTSAELDQLAELIDQAMQAADYSPANMRDANRHDTNLLLRRLTLSSRDARRILGLFRRILWRLKN